MNGFAKLSEDELSLLYYSYIYCVACFSNIGLMAVNVNGLETTMLHI